jgi:predicted Zn-dependent protease
MKRIARWALIVVAFLPAAGCAALAIEEGGFNLISLDEEWSMREDMLKQVEQQYTLFQDARAQAFLDEIGRRLVSQSPLADRPWTFGIVDDDGVNAFNLPGGLVFVNRGLAEHATTLDQFTAVVGHEIAHGTARHGTQLMTRAMGIDLLSGALLGDDPSNRDKMLKDLVGSGVLSDYGRDAEREADRLGIRYSYAAGYDPRGAVRMFEMLLSLRQGRPSTVGQWFSSHPLTEERIAQAEEIVAGMPATSSLVKDTPEYQAFRRRLSN